MKKKEQYDAPELTLVGEARDVVLGWGGAGTDLYGEENIPEMEFASD